MLARRDDEAATMAGEDVSMNADNASKRQLSGALTTMHTQGLPICRHLRERRAPRCDARAMMEAAWRGVARRADSPRCTMRLRRRAVAHSSNYRRDARVHRVEARAGAETLLSHALHRGTRATIRDHRHAACNHSNQSPGSTTTPKFP